MGVRDLASTWTLTLKSKADAFTTKDVQRELRKVGDAAEDMARDTRRATKRIDDGLRSTKSEAAGLGREVGEEFQQNIGEAIASGDFGDVAMSTIGGVAASLTGPLAAAFGVAAGAASLLWGSMKEQAERANEIVQEMVGALQGAQGEMDNLTKRQSAFKLFGDNVVDAQKKINKWAQEIGVNSSDIVDYVAGMEPKPDQVAAFQKIADSQKDTVYWGTEAVYNYEGAVGPLQLMRQEMAGYADEAERAYRAQNGLKDKTVTTTFRVVNAPMVPGVSLNPGQTYSSILPAAPASGYRTP